MARLVVGLIYLAALVGEAVRSYYSPNYRYDFSDFAMVIGLLGAITILVWWRQHLKLWNWVLAAGLVAAALAAFPGTSRDPFRYLFDGEMIRLWHASPYIHLPYEFPIDQYSRVFQHIWWTAIPSPYGPLWQALMVGINFASGNQLGVGLILLKLVNLAGLVVMTRYLYLITRKPWVAYGVLINPVVLLNTVATPHTDVVIAAALAAAYYHRGVGWRGLGLGAAALIKPHALLLVPFLAKSWRALLMLGAATTAITAVLLLTLKPMVGFDWMAMLRASQGGSVAGTESLLMYGLFPAWPRPSLYALSYGLFLAVYAMVLVLYARRRLGQLPALALASLLVPFCLIGLVLPWHFIVPIMWLAACERRAATLTMLGLTVLVMRSAMAVPQLLGMLGLAWAAYELVRWIYRSLSKRPALLVRVVRSIRL